MAGAGTAHLNPASESLLRAENLVVEFPVGNTGLKVHAVSGISFDIREGETLGLVGESGCGKSTTGKALMQVPRPTSGKVVLDGQDLSSFDQESIRVLRSKMQMIFQDPISSLNPRRTIGDIVAEPLVIQWSETVPRSAVSRMWQKLVRWMVPLWKKGWSYARYPMFGVVLAGLLWVVGEAADETRVEGALGWLKPIGRILAIVAGVALAPFLAFVLAGVVLWILLVVLMPLAAIPRALKLRAGRSAFKAESDEKVRRALSTVGLDPGIAMPKRRHEFSGGQCQRICIARALVLDPKVLICDEPVSALDVSVQAQILNLLEDMKAEYGLTMIFISHDLAVVKNISDRVAVMYLGKMCEVAPADTIYDYSAHPYSRALLRAIPVPDPLVDQTKIEGITGEIPSPVFPPSGCRFRTRCPYAQERCSEDEPEMREIETGHFVACHFPLDRPEAPVLVNSESAAV